jgi:hypothetical protein
MLSSGERDKYCEKADAMRKRGVQVGDVLICDDGAQPRLHDFSGKPHVRILEYCLIDGTGPRFFVHGYRRGLVAYVPNEKISPGTKLRVVRKSERSVVLEPVDA